MIRGIGIDVADIGRFRDARDPAGLLEQILSPAEIAGAAAGGPRSAALLFSVKEAVVKALGCGMTGGWLWREIAVSEDLRVTLTGSLRELAERRGVSRIMVSHSRSADHVVSLVLLEG